jgi:DNA polymerase-3 subunit epsilon
VSDNRLPREEPPAGPPWDLPLAEAPLVFVDLEMTGLDARKDRVIEVCAERFRGDQLEGSVATLVDPEGHFGNDHVHGIERAALAQAPRFASIAADVERLLEGAVLVAHAAAWDVAFLEAELARAGRERRVPFYLDTLTLARRAFALPSHSLAALCEQFGIVRARAHRATDDVAALREVWRRCVAALLPRSPRDLWHVRVGRRHARPDIVAEAVVAAETAEPVRVRYRPARRGRAPSPPPLGAHAVGPATPRPGEAGVQELDLVVTQVRTDLDPPRVLGYLLPSRGRRELRADRILAIETLAARGVEATEE